MATYGENRLYELLRRLLLATEQGSASVEWHESDRNNAFHASIGGATVVIASDDNDGRYPYSLEILDEEGVLVDTLKSGMYENENGEYPCDWNEDLEALYDMARRSVTNIDGVLDGILNFLPELPPRYSDDPPF
jgi:hypothetical protein